MQIKTIVGEKPEEFDAKVNSALASGFHLIRRGPEMVGEHYVIYAELVKYDDTMPIEDMLPDPEPEPEEEAEDCGCCGNKQCQPTAGKVCVDSVLSAMQFMKWCCEHTEACPDCPLFPYCRSRMPYEWHVEHL